MGKFPHADSGISLFDYLTWHHTLHRFTEYIWFPIHTENTYRALFLLLILFAFINKTYSNE